ncbi:MAG: diguanylate cyclase [Deltaproteobacteria bacterium]|nr:diguanylate cyclase [Deltaproteobacteria bacterium]
MTKHESIRILYIEDDPGLARLVQKRLGRVGYEVDIAADGEEGIAKYEADSYDLMFVDQTLPVYDGLEVIRKLGSQGVLPPTVMITGTGDERVAVEAMKLGAGDYIVKDVEGGYLELLPSVVEKVLDQRRAITEKQRAEEALKESGDKLESLHEVARRLAACTSEEEVYHLAVDAARRIITFSYCSLGMVEGKEIVTKVAYPHPVSHEAQKVTVDEGLAGATYTNGKTHFLRELGKRVANSSSSSRYLSLISSPIGDLGVFQVASLEPDAFTRDDTRLLELLLGHTAAAIKRVRLQNELKEQAIHDPLTGLHNRYYLDAVLSQEIKRSKRYKHCMAFLMVDVNRFKEINDQYGHQMGDEVLKEVAVLLRESVRESDIVVRYGGDEFVIVLLETDGESETVKQRIVKKIALRNKKNGRFDFPVTLSIGSTYWDPQDSKSVEEVLNEADRHMYEEKKKNNGVVKGGSHA